MDKEREERVISQAEPQKADDVARGVVIDESDGSPGPVLAAISKPANIDGSGFFNVDNVDDPVPEIVLRRVVQDGREIFQLERPIGYWDTHVGGLIVPHNLASFFTDLTSVPQVLTWLIPKTGKHLPAALLHDGLVLGTDEPQTYIANEPISRVEADRIFRDAMRDVETPSLTRWLVWAAVAAATKTKTMRWTDDAGEEVAEAADASTPELPNLVASQNWLGWLVVAGTSLIIAALGTVATLELFDCLDIIPALEGKPVLAKLGLGAAAAIAVPSALSILWGREWRAGIILGVAISLLLHLMAAIVVVFGLFRAVDNFTAARYGPSALWLFVSAGVAGAIAALVMLVCL